MANVEYRRVNWEAYPSTGTKISVGNLNQMDSGIAECAEAINAANNEILNVNSKITARYSGHDVPFQFGIDASGNYGYIKEGETTVSPFRTRHTETIKPTTRATVDMGLYHAIRYVDLSAVPNINSQTYAATARSTSIDMGAANTIRYVNTSNVPNANSGTYNVTANGTFDMGATNANRYVSVNVPNPAYGTNLLTNTISGISIVQTYGCSWSGTSLYVSAIDCGGIVIQNDSGYGRYIIVITDREVESTYQCGLGTTQATLPSVISSGAYRDGNNYVSALHTMAIGKTVPTGKRFYFGTQLADPERDYYILAVLVV